MNVRSLRPRVRLTTILLLFALILSLIPATVFADTGPTSFDDEFDSLTLDPAWQVVEFTGTRVYGYTSPANHISLTANPGYLRYYLDPMTHAWGFLNGYQVYNPYYPYDYGLELHRPFSGQHWIFESKANFYLPYTNGRGEDIHVYFGDGGVNTFMVIFQRYRDVNPHPNELTIGLVEKFGPTFDDRASLEYYMTSGDIYGPPDSTYLYRLERNGSILTTSWSPDGITWTQAWSRDMGSQLDGLQQRLVITGLSWTDDAGYYADYDYVRLNNTAPLPVIDIKPGEPDNVISLGARGKMAVAVLSNEEFSAPDEMDRSSLTFGRTGDEKSLLYRKGDQPNCSVQDVNADERADLVCYFLEKLTGFQLGDTEGILKGATVTGAPIEGHDVVNIVP